MRIVCKPIVEGKFMQCKQIAEDECNEMMINEKTCTHCMIKKLYILLRGKNDLQSGK
jgi:hypothetical protein